MSTRSLNLWWRILQEAGTIMTALGIFLAYFWLFAQANIDKYVENLIGEKHYATLDELNQIKVTMGKLQDQQEDTGKVVAKMDGKIDSVVQNTQNTTNLLNRLLVTMSTGKQAQ